MSFRLPSTFGGPRDRELRSGKWGAVHKGLNTPDFPGSTWDSSSVAAHSQESPDWQYRSFSGLWGPPEWAIIPQSVGPNNVIQQWQRHAPPG